MRVLVTGGAGFIGSNLVEELLRQEKVSHVRVLDNLATGSMDNLQPFLDLPKFEFVEGDIREYAMCAHCCKGIDLISHQAALGSVPRSINDPRTTNDVNITGTLNIFTAARESKVKRVVYASSSSVYGDHPALPKVESVVGSVLSPYALTKWVNELYAQVHAKVYGMELIGLRYFNIFGPNQSPNGPYAAVIPLFIKGILENKAPVINGDGKHSRDFTYIDNAVQANILALFTSNRAAINQAYNIACGYKISLVDLFNSLKATSQSDLQPEYGPERPGDVMHSMADISKAKELLGYEPRVAAEEGLRKTFEWYKLQLKSV